MSLVRITVATTKFHGSSKSRDAFEILNKPNLVAVATKDPDGNRWTRHRSVGDHSIKFTPNGRHVEHSVTTQRA